MLEGEPVAEGQLQHLKVINEITSQCKIYKSYLFKVLKIGAQLDRIWVQKNENEKWEVVC